MPQSFDQVATNIKRIFLGAIRVSGNNYRNKELEEQNLQQIKQAINLFELPLATVEAQFPELGLSK